MAWRRHQQVVLLHHAWNVIPLSTHSHQHLCTCKALHHWLTDRSQNFAAWSQVQMHGTSTVSSWEGGRPGLPVCSSWGQAVQYLDQKRVSQVTLHSDLPARSLTHTALPHGCCRSYRHPSVSALGCRANLHVDRPNGQRPNDQLTSMLTDPVVSHVKP